MTFQLIAPPHTPFDSNGDLNLDAIDLQARLFTAHGVTGVFVCGSTGEGESLSLDERKAMTERWSVAGPAAGLRTMVHVGRNSMREAIELARQADAAGVDAIAALAPSYFKPQSVSDLIDFLKPIAAAAPSTPFFFYDIPGMTGVSLSTVEFLRRGGDVIPTLAGVKFTNSDFALFQECVRLDDGRYEILFGRDEALLASRALGAGGAVGSTYNFAPQLYFDAIAAYDAGDEATARERQAAAVALVRMLEPYGFLAASKVVMQHCGVDCGPVRAPLRNLTEAQRDELQLKLRQLPYLARIDRSTN